MYASLSKALLEKMNSLKRDYNQSILFLFTSVLPLTLLLQINSAFSKELVELTLEELSNIQVSSVSKRSEMLSDAAASIFVITNNDIQRSGATNLPEALRLAPNLQVAQDSARNYAIAARGFNSLFSNKLLVLIDGRTVYTPLFSGVYWNAQDVVLEDIERIEVISGAGGTIWGTNAVNGVINIITKNASKTQGGLISITGSDDEKYSAVRYGGALDNGGSFRVYAKHAEGSDNRSEATDLSLNDGYRRDKAGFRADWKNDNKNFTLQGDFYDGYLHQFNTNDIQISGANLLARVNTTLENGSNLYLQGYVVYTYRN
jgi:iron complex outermembrane receptor protein